MPAQSTKPARKPRGYWTKPRVSTEARKYDNRVDFSRQSSGAFKKAFRKGWLEDVCAHMAQKPQNYWTDARIGAEARKYKTRSEFSRESASAYTTAKKKGLLDAVCAHMEGLVSRPRGYWTESRIKDAAEPFKTRKEFAKENSAAYHAAKRRGMLDDVCAHMEPGRKK